ncbi:MAG: anti-sigma factor [Longimicrobiales bacterium]
MSNDHIWTEYAASYALGALDSEDRVAFEAHLTGCAACRAEVQAYQDVTGLIGQSAPPVAAPPQLKHRILAEARKVRPITSVATLKLKRPRSSVLPWLLAAASIVVALSLGLFYTQERAARLAAQNDVQTAQTQLAITRSEVARNDSVLAALLAPDLQTAALAAQGRPPSARLYYSRDRNTVVLTAHDLQPAPSGRTYQLWGIADGQAVSLGTFNTGSNGSAVVTLVVPAGARFQVSAITDEPAGGSPQPTTTPFLVGNWSAP